MLKLRKARSVTTHKRQRSKQVSEIDTQTVVNSYQWTVNSKQLNNYSLFTLDGSESPPPRGGGRFQLGFNSEQWTVNS